MLHVIVQSGVLEILVVNHLIILLLQHRRLFLGHLLLLLIEPLILRRPKLRAAFVVGR